MSSFTVPTYEQAPAETKAAFDQYKQGGNNLPNLYATIGYSGNALSSYMQYVRAQAKNTFHVREREAIYLIVSQLNGCEYCLASHTQSAIKAGWKEEDTLAIRAGNHPDKKWQTIYAVVRSVIENKGAVSDTLVQDFYSLDYKEAGLIDLVVLINVMSFTNYIYRLTQIPIDFPTAKPI